VKQHTSHWVDITDRLGLCSRRFVGDIQLVNTESTPTTSKRCRIATDMFQTGLVWARPQAVLPKPRRKDCLGRLKELIVEGVERDREVLPRFPWQTGAHAALQLLLPFEELSPTPRVGGKHVLIGHLPKRFNKSGITDQ
jgi:hypothetical protein